MVASNFKLTVVALLVVSISQLSFALTAVQKCRNVLKNNGFFDERNIGYKNFQIFFNDKSITLMEEDYCDTWVPSRQTEEEKNFRRFTRELVMRLEEVLFDNNQIDITSMFDQVEFCNTFPSKIHSKLPVHFPPNVYTVDVLKEKCEEYVAHVKVYNYPQLDDVHDVFKTFYDKWPKKNLTFEGIFGYEKPIKPLEQFQRERVFFFDEVTFGLYKQFSELINNLSYLNGDFEDNEEFCKVHGAIIVGKYNISLTNNERMIDDLD